MPAFNPEQLATYAEARAIRDFLNAAPHFVGRNVLPGDDEKGSDQITIPNPNFPWLPPVVAKVGIYRPSWTPGPGGFPEPHEGEDRFYLHFRFANGFAGCNVGLIRTKFEKYPNSPLYVLSEIAKEVLP